jgi:hypothetical protein
VPGALKVRPVWFYILGAKYLRGEVAPLPPLAFMAPLTFYGMTATPQGSRFTGTDFSALSDAISMTVARCP